MKKSDFQSSETFRDPEMLSAPSKGEIRHAEDAEAAFLTFNLEDVLEGGANPNFLLLLINRACYPETPRRGVKS